MTEFRGQRTEFRGQSSDDRAQRTEFRGQRTDDRGLTSEFIGDAHTESTLIYSIVMRFSFMKDNFSVSTFQCKGSARMFYRHFFVFS